ncbi:hypothetical protein [Streptomyces sp. NBC_00198]|uniref:hypothetical protein n=1 Tax=Streptomyces sp. NBC_00198 TaxID=2975677 RepID=UPI002256B1A9|nr:hypothetical protein [Streptomyces sp. NBC_00198]MCX5278655.1 hypothetical protein [Streptomyces sp. NBC_00198]
MSVAVALSASLTVGAAPSRAAVGSEGLGTAAGSEGLGTAAGSEGLGKGDSPDLALVIAGDTGRTVTLHSGDRDFGRLWRLLAPRFTGTEQVPDAWAHGDYPAVRATVVWGLTGVGGWPQTARAPGGDVAVERQDQVFLARDGTPWVRTDVSPDVVDDDIRWHRAPRSLFGQLARDGKLFGPQRAAPVSTGRAARERAEWALAGVAAGLLMGAGIPWCRRRAATRRENAGSPREPRQELVDL